MQGVGFHSFLYRLTRDHSLFSWVRPPFGMEMELEGTPNQLKAFEQTLTLSSPSLAVAEQVQTTLLDTLVHFEKNSILPSTEDGGALVSPDIALCPACKKELKRPRRPALSLSIHQLHRFRSLLHPHLGPSL